MPCYYIYTLGDDGHIQSRVNAICDDDEQAKRHAKRLVDGHVVELWQEARKIAVILSAAGSAPHIRVKVPPEQ